MNTTKLAYDCYAFFSKKDKIDDVNISSHVDKILSAKINYIIVDNINLFFYYMIDNYPKNENYDSLIKKIGYNREEIKKEFVTIILKSLIKDGYIVGKTDIEIIDSYNELEKQKGNKIALFINKDKELLLFKDNNEYYGFFTIGKKIIKEDDKCFLESDENFMKRIKNDSNIDIKSMKFIKSVNVRRSTFIDVYVCTLLNEYTVDNENSKWINISEKDKKYINNYTSVILNSL